MLPSPNIEIFQYLLMLYNKAPQAKGANYDERFHLMSGEPFGISNKVAVYYKRAKDPDPNTVNFNNLKVERILINPGNSNEALVAVLPNN